MKYYKFLNEDLTTTHGYTEYETDCWMPVIEGALVPCENGYHVLREQDLVHWLGAVLWEVEVGREIVESNDKVVVRSVRLIKRVEQWNERTQRLFTCDCAEHALTYVNNPDPRSIDAIRVSRLYANGEAMKDELDAAYDAALKAVASAAAASAASAVVYDASVAAASAAVYSKRAAAVYSKRAAAVAASDEREWQTVRLMEYLK